jgi:hypothetical protein
MAFPCGRRTMPSWLCNPKQRNGRPNELISVAEARAATNLSRKVRRRSVVSTRIHANLIYRPLDSTRMLECVPRDPSIR